VSVDANRNDETINVEKMKNVTGSKPETCVCYA
jgi:hypothetical protein